MFSHVEEDGDAETIQRILGLQGSHPYDCAVETLLERLTLSWWLVRAVLALVDTVQSLPLIPWECYTEEERLETP